MSKRAAVERWMEKVASLDCIICGARPVELHHIREGQGAGQRAPDTLVIPVCAACHRGSEGIHGLGRKGFYMRYKRDELDYLADTIEALA